MILISKQLAKLGFVASALIALAACVPANPEVALSINGIDTESDAYISNGKVIEIDAGDQLTIEARVRSAMADNRENSNFPTGIERRYYIVDDNLRSEYADTNLRFNLARCGEGNPLLGLGSAVLGSGVYEFTIDWACYQAEKVRSFTESPSLDTTYTLIAIEQLKTLLNFAVIGRGKSELSINVSVNPDVPVSKITGSATAIPDDRLRTCVITEALARGYTDVGDVTDINCGQYASGQENTPLTDRIRDYTGLRFFYNLKNLNLDYTFPTYTGGTGLDSLYFLQSLETLSMDLGEAAGVGCNAYVKLQEARPFLKILAIRKTNFLGVEVCVDSLNN